MKKTTVLIIAIFLFTACNQQEWTVAKRQTFLQTLDIHLSAIANKDLEALRPTVADSVAMISPDGDKMDSKEVFMEFHKNWFEQKNWEWERTILKTENTDSLGYALIQYTYSQKDTLDNILFRDRAYLVLIFKNAAEGWQLIHDQNTQIKKSEK